MVKEKGMEIMVIEECSDRCFLRVLSPRLMLATADGLLSNPDISRIFEQMDIIAGSL